MTFNPRYCHNEREVASKFIAQYLLPRLGYAIDSWFQEVTFETIRVDFLVSAHKPSFRKKLSPHHCFIIEAKNPRENLTHHIHQVQRYLSQAKVPWGLLTNGYELRLYRRDKDTIKLAFQCAGRDIDSKLETLNSFIGREALAVATNPINPPDPTPKLPMKTIAIYHHKGGVGKTTVATNLAAAFSKKGKRVLLIDIDAQANSTFAVGLIKFQFDEEDDLRDKNVFHLLEGNNELIPDIVRKSQGFCCPEIDVIPSHITLIEKQQFINENPATFGRIDKKLKSVVDDYDLVIIDTPPSLDLYAKVALIAADYLIIPSDLKPFSNQGLESVKKFIKEKIDDPREDRGKSPLKILGILPSKISPNAQYLKHAYPKQKQLILDKYNLPVMETMISERMALSRCINQIVTVGELQIPDPQSIISYAENQADAGVSASEFDALAIEVLNKIEVM